MTPVKPYTRFTKQMQAGTGLDPNGSFKHFTSKDPTFNLDVHRDRKRELTLEYARPIPYGQVPVGTTKCTYKIGLDLNAKLKREPSRFSPQSFPRNPTDVVSQEPPPYKRPF